jgi:phytoene synthase
MNPTEYCRQRAAASGSSFYYSFLFLPKPRREAITALYAYCREVDDVVDETRDAGIAQQKLAWWRDELERIYAGRASHPVGLALHSVVRDFDLPRPQMLAIIDGMAMDLAQTRYANFAALRTYCYHVAGVVGLLAARIFGYANAATLSYAERLGVAFQLTNIIRDVGEDAGRGRIYLPLDELDRFDVTPDELLRGEVSPGLRALLQFQIERAEGLYSEALALLPAEDRRSQRAGLIMAAIYRSLLREIRRDNTRVMRYRVSLTPLHKLWLAWRTWTSA